jgi:hypothetical protein
MPPDSIPDEKTPSISIEELKKHKENVRKLKSSEVSGSQSETKSPLDSKPALKGWDKFQVEHPIIKYLYDFLFLIVIYGFLLNFTMMVILKIPLNIITSLGFGVAFYFIKEEMPRIIQRCLIRRTK